MKVCIVTSGLYHEYKIDSVYLDREKAKEKKRSLEATGSSNVIVHDFQTHDGLDKEIFQYYYEAQITYNKEGRFVNNIILEHPERIMRHVIEKRKVPKREYDKQEIKDDEETVIIVKSYVSRQHCFEKLKEECDKVIKGFTK